MSSKKEERIQERKRETSRWKAFRSKRKLVLGLILFHFGSVGLLLVVTNFVTNRTIRLDIMGLWGISIAGITYTLVVASPLMIKTTKTENQ